MVKQKYAWFSAMMLFVMLAVGCSDTEQYYDTTYIYRNEAQQSVQVSYPIYYPDEPDNPNDPISLYLMRKDFYVGADNDEHIVSLRTTGGFAPPMRFYLQQPSDSDSLIVFYGSKRIVYHYKHKEGLYSIRNYELVTSSGYERTYRYTFRDKDFE